MVESGVSPMSRSARRGFPSKNAISPNCRPRESGTCYQRLRIAKKSEHVAEAGKARIASIQAARHARDLKEADRLEFGLILVKRRQLTEPPAHAACTVTLYRCPFDILSLLAGLICVTELSFRSRWQRPSGGRHCPYTSAAELHAAANTSCVTPPKF